MLFGNKIYTEGAEASVNDVDLLAGDADPNTEAGQEAIAAEVENNMQAAALESMTYFDGGEEAQKAFSESAEVQALVEAQKMSKKTFVRLNKKDDLTRRAHLASLILARNAKDPLFTKLAQNRVKERQLRKQIFARYQNKAVLIAKRSQKQHIKTAAPLPKVKFN